MNLDLKRPLAFFDLETTGLDIAHDRIIEISIVKISPDGKEEKYTRRINPTIPISEESKKITGITDEDVKDMPVFKDVAKEIVEFFGNSDLAGYNSNRFDIPLLAEEFIRADIDFDFEKRKFVDVQVIYHKKEQRTLSAAYKFYCDKNLEDAHSAEADTYATYEVLKKQIEKYDDIKNDINFLSSFSYFSKNADFAGRIVYNNKDEVVFNFGKYKGKKVIDVFAKDSGYYGWIMKADFPLYTKKILSKIKLSMIKM